ncbi:FecR family protein [Pinibacter soli]|uniref:FecR family protein n=1 Tax=Pinibacter soli TaxID=3044211 RepID=A0ABT6R9L1_9BACT|nr:FecR family protein [Pinibacter soli]MDI3319237.1 FecR family protein [Pinibacter soli]
MDLKKQLEALLRKDEWSDEEKEMMLNYLNSSDTKELEELLKQHYFSGNPDQPVLPESQQVLEEIHQKISGQYPDKKAKVVPIWIKRVAVAASLIIVVGTAWKLFLPHNQVANVAQKVNEIKDSARVIARHIENHSGREKKVVLPDSSLVLLANNSELNYNEPFIDRRDINLTGKASFKIAKDKSRPFSVYSGAVSTTVLGTEFSVNAYPANEKLTVRLYTGKVVVKPVMKDDWRMSKDFYLKPGEEFIYNNQALAKVNLIKKQGTDVEAGNDESGGMVDADAASSVAASTTSRWYMFNNQSLKQVIDQLSAIYEVPIVYDEKDLQKKYFIGKFNKTDSLEVILNYITKINHLKITRKDNQYFITK